MMTTISHSTQFEIREAIHSLFFGEVVLRNIRASNAPKAALDAAFLILADEPPDKTSLAVDYMHTNVTSCMSVVRAISQMTTQLVQELEVLDHRIDSTVLRRILARDVDALLHIMYILPMVQSDRVHLDGISVLDLKPYPGSITAFLNNPNYDPQKDPHLADALQTAVRNYYGELEAFEYYDDDDLDPERIDVLFFEFVFKHPRIIATADFRPALALAIRHNVPAIVSYLLEQTNTDSSMVNLSTHFPKFQTLTEGARDVVVLGLLLKSRKFDFDLLRRSEIYTREEMTVIFAKAAIHGNLDLADTLFRWIEPGGIDVGFVARLVWQMANAYIGLKDYQDVLRDLMTAHAYFRSPALLNECLFDVTRLADYDRMQFVLSLRQVDPVEAFQNRVHLLSFFRATDARIAWLVAEILDIHGRWTLDMSLPFLPPRPDSWTLVHLLMRKDYMGARMLLRTYPMLNRDVVDEYIYDRFFIDFDHIEATIVLMEDLVWNLPTKYVMWIRMLIRHNHAVCRRYFRHPPHQDILENAERRLLVGLRDMEMLVSGVRVDGEEIGDVRPALAEFID